MDTKIYKSKAMFSNTGMRRCEDFHDFTVNQRLACFDSQCWCFVLAMFTKLSASAAEWFHSQHP